MAFISLQNILNKKKDTFVPVDVSKRVQPVYPTTTTPTAGFQFQTQEPLVSPLKTTTPAFMLKPEIRVRDVLKEMPSATKKISIEIGQSIMRNMASLIGSEAFEPITKHIEKFMGKIERKSPTFKFFTEELAERLYGDLSSLEKTELTGETRAEQIAPIGKRVMTMENKLAKVKNEYDETLKLPNLSINEKVVLKSLSSLLKQKALAPLIIGIYTGLDIVPFGGSEKNVLKVFKQTTKLDDAYKVLRKLGLSDNLVRQFAPEVVKVKTTKKAKLLFEDISNVQLKTKAGEPQPAFGLSIQPREKVGYGVLETFQPPTELSAKLLENFRGMPEKIKVGRMEEIINLTKKQGLRPVEEEMFRKSMVIEKGEVNLSKTAAKVEEQLVPLTPTLVKSPRWSNVGEEFIGDGKYGEVVYQSPIKTSAGDVHFQQRTLPMNRAERAKVEQSFSNYFSHIRYEDMADGRTRKILETQSDLFQKENFAQEAFPRESAKSVAERKRMNAQRTKELEPLQPYSSNDPLAHLRTFREEVKRATKDGKDTLLIPSGETAMKIEGLGQLDDFYFITSEGESLGKVTTRNMKIGSLINGAGNDWIITDILGEGKFKAVPKKQYDDWTKLNPDMKMGTYYRQRGMNTLREIPKNEQIEIQKQQLENFTETFDISGKVDTKHFVYKLNEEAIPREARKMGLEVVGKIKKDNGVWWKIKIPKEFAKKPVIAFKKEKGLATEGYIGIRGRFDMKKGDMEVLLKRLLPEADIEFLTNDKIFYKGREMGGLYNPRAAFGKHTQSLIEIVENKGLVKSRVGLHEAGHAFENHFLTDTETIKYRRLIREHDPRIKTDRAASERLWEEFAEYLKTGRTWSDVLLQLFRRIAAKIKEWAGIARRVKGEMAKENPDVKRLFDEIIEVKRKRPLSLQEKFRTDFEIKGLAKKPLKEEEAARQLIEKEIRKEMGTAGELAAAIRQEGGIKISGGIEEEIKTNVPIFLLRREGTRLDEMVERLKNHGIHFEDNNELLSALSEIPGRRIPLKRERPPIFGQKQIRPRLTDFEKQILAAEKRGIATGKEFAKEKIARIKTAKDILQRRRTLIKSVKRMFGLSDADLRKISRKDIRLMSDYEFHQYLNDIEFKALQFSEKRQTMNELIQQIQDKELKVENLRKAMKLPTLKNMTIDHMRKLDETLKPFQKGDEFLSVRKLEVVDRTELKGIKTWREARERLAQKLNVPVEKLQNIRVSEFDRFRYDTGLAERNEFYKMMVEEPAKRMLISEAEYLKIEKETFNLAKKIKPKGFLERLIPQQKRIRQFMEATPEEKAKMDLTKPELDLVKHMTGHFENARDYLIQLEAMRLGKENYFTHIRRGILEAVKEDGIIQAVKEIFNQYKLEEQGFNILDGETGEILAMDKFFRFAMHRAGTIKPTENVVKAFLTYMKIFKKKQALDEIVPLIDIYAQSITPKGLTKKGLLLHGNLIRFVKEWLNTQKGRHITLIAKQNGKIDGALRTIKMFTSLRDLGINIPVSVFTEVGEQITTYQLLGKRKYLLGKIRQLTSQGRKIVENNRALIGKNPWKQLIEPAKEIGNRLMEGIFILFRDASERSNRTFFLGSLSKEEFKTGIVSPERLAALRTELGRYRVVEGMKSVIGATPEGRAYTQYKKFAISILRTTIKNLNNIGKRIIGQKVDSKEFKKSALELYRLVEITAFAMLAFSLVQKQREKKDFTGQMINKAYRESTTLIQALNPEFFLSAGRTVSFIEELGVNLKLILTGEKYKTTGKYKSLEGLKRQFTPVAVSQFKEEKTKKGLFPERSSLEEIFETKQLKRPSLETIFNF